MSEVSDVQQETAVEESAEKTGSELDRYIEQQPRSIRTAHTLMLAVPRWWMASQVCVGLLLLIVGLHTLVVKAYSPTPPGTKDSIVTGREAVGLAWKPLGLGILWAAAWGGMYLFIVLSEADPMGTFIPFVVIVSIGLGVAWAIWAGILKRRRSQ